MERKNSGERKELARRWMYQLSNSLVQTHEVLLDRPVRALLGPRVATFCTGLYTSRDLGKTLGLGEELALELGAESCRISRSYGDIVFEIPFPRGLRNSLGVESIEQKGDMWLSLGLSTHLQRVSCNICSPSVAPILVAGRTGAGKTEALKLMLWELATNNSPEDIRFVVYDPKYKFEAFANSTHLALPILRNKDDLHLGMVWLLQELNRRMEHNYSSPVILLLIDELLEIVSYDEEAIDAGLGRLASIGRELKMLQVVATQRPDTKSLGVVGSANIGFRLVGRVSNTTEATMATGIGGTGAHLLGNRGDMLAVQGSDVHRLQTALLTPDKLDSLGKGELNISLDRYDPGELYSLAGLDSIELKPEFTPEEVAIGLTDIGILKLRERLHMGQNRATRLREFSKGIIEELGKLGREIVEVK